MSNIELFGDFDGIEAGVYTDGTTFLSGNGLATLCDVSREAIRGIGHEVPTIDSFGKDLKIYQLLQEYKYDGDFLYSKVDVPSQPKSINAYPEVVCMVILEYYAFEAEDRYKTQKAKDVARVLLRKSFRDFIYALVGYKQKQTSFSDYMLSRITHHHQVSVNPLPDGYFCLFDKMIEILQKFDSRLGYKLGEQWYDTREDKLRFLEPDISLGIKFSQFFSGIDLSIAQQNYDDKYQQQLAKPKRYKFWAKELINLKWQLEIAKAIDKLKKKYNIPIIKKLQVDDFTQRKKYNFNPSPDSNRPEDLSAYCYPNKYLPLFQDWLSEVFFRFFWRGYIVERDNEGWIKRYLDFQSMPIETQKAILTTTEGKLIEGFEFYDKWYKSLPVDPRP